MNTVAVIPFPGWVRVAIWVLIATLCWGTVAAAEVDGTAPLPEQGEPVLDSDEQEQQKTCVPVCRRWGQECTYSRHGPRNCRRTCKHYATECFVVEEE